MNQEAYRQLLRRRCRDSFWEFLLIAYGAKYNPKGKRWLDPTIHKPLCDWFQSKVLKWIEARKDGKGYPLHLMVLVPRDVGKTTTITQAGLLWMHLLDPDISTYIGSERTEFAVDILDPIKNIMDGTDSYAQFSWLYGNWYDKARTWSQKQLVHAARENLSRKEPSFGIWGVESGITGKHPDVLCLDDPTSYEKMESVGKWLQLVNSHIDSLIPVLPSDGLLIFVGTRYHDADHFGVAASKEGLKSISGMPMPRSRTVDDGKWDCYFLAARDAEGVPAIPSVWSEQRLKDYQRRNPLKYAAQVLNDPMSAEHNQLPLERLENYIVDDITIPKNVRITFHMDTAFKTREQEARGDYTVLCEMAHALDGTGTVYWLNTHASNTLKAEEFRDLLLSRYQFWRSQGRKVALMTDEPVVGKGELWEMAIRNWFNGIGQPCPPLIILHRGNKKKTSRHMDAAQFVLDGKVFFARNGQNRAMLFDQLSKIGVSEYDDAIDAFADAFHPSCYTVMHKSGPRPLDDDSEYLTQPWDSYLKGNYRDKLEQDLGNLGFY
jgi:hypothetical protein